MDRESSWENERVREKDRMRWGKWGHASAINV